MPPQAPKPPPAAVQEPGAAASGVEPGPARRVRRLRRGRRGAGAAAAAASGAMPGMAGSAAGCAAAAAGCAASEAGGAAFSAVTAGSAAASRAAPSSARIKEKIVFIASSSCGPPSLQKQDGCMEAPVFPFSIVQRAGCLPSTRPRQAPALTRVEQIW